MSDLINDQAVAPPRHILLLIPIFSAFIFGMYPPASRAVYAHGGNAVFVVIITTWVRALFLTLICKLGGQNLFPSREALKQAVTGGFFQAISILGIIGSLVFLPGPVTIIIIFSHTIMLLFFLAWRREIQLDAVTIVTTLFALFGLSLTVDLWHQLLASQWIGIGLAFVAALATVSRLYVYGKQTKIRSAGAIGAENFLIAAILVTLAAFVQWPHPPASATGWGWVAVSAVSLSLGSLGMFYGIALLGSFRWSLFSKLEPVFTSIFSFAFMNEVLAARQYFGIGLVIASLAIYQFMAVRDKATRLKRLSRKDRRK